MKSFESFVSGLFIGVTAGVVAGVLLAPKSGAETREDIKKMGQDVADKVTGLYEEAKDSLNRKVRALKKLGTKIDETKYREMIDQVVTELKKNRQVAADTTDDITALLKNDWKDVKAALLK